MEARAEIKLTPLMQQYLQIKQQHADALLLFQVGDFYELFFKDAQVASSFLGIALTKRGNVQGEPIPLCGVPLHARDHYISKLVRGGFKVALCDQLEEPRPGMIVNRGVTQVLTPGTLVDEKLLDAKMPSYLLSFFPTTESVALVCGELLAAQLFATTIACSAHTQLEAELLRFFPDEILVPAHPLTAQFEPLFKKHGYRTTVVEQVENTDEVRQWVAKSAPNVSDAVVYAFALFQAYVYKNQKIDLNYFDSIKFYRPDEFLVLDGATQRNLELTRNNYDGSRSHTLLSVLDGTQTPMGSRMVSKWIGKPLVERAAIEERQAVVAWVSDQTVWRKTISALLAQVGDLERIVGRVALARAQLNDYLALACALKIVPVIARQLMDGQSLLLQAYVLQLADFSVLEQLLHAALNDDGQKEWLIKQGFDYELDRLRTLVEGAAVQIVEFERSEQLRTGISTLKVRYVKPYGYSIEITKSNRDAIPADYDRQQSLSGRERFTTKKLQQLQEEILWAQNEIEAKQEKVFQRVKAEVLPFVSLLRRAAYVLAQLDALVGLATVAYNHGYRRPEMSDGHDLIITGGRHPVVEQNQSFRFISNDTRLTDEQSLLIITGPNMGGKSTYLRQNALIALMAHIGSLVPAQSAIIPIMDRIFTRIGASDYVAHGKSTFLVEMEETATICANATQRSLVILDEIGRGTSTYDGLAIAWAVAQYIHEVKRARCLFATHYHELTDLQKKLSGVGVYFAASKRTASGIVLLYKIVQGVADGSFGIEVAKMAGLPVPVVAHAQELIGHLHGSAQGSFSQVKGSDAVNELQVLKRDYAVLHEAVSLLQEIDYDNLSPKQAFDLLWKARSALENTRKSRPEDG